MDLSIKDEIKKDLCRQYSENENHRQTILISFLTVLIASCSIIGITFRDFIHNTDEKNLILFFVGVLFNVFIFSIPIILSIILGYMLRRDQLIVDQIRRNEFKNKYDNFFNIYSPFKKGCDFLQDLNKFFIIISLIFQLLFVVLFFISICCMQQFSCNTCFGIIIFSFLIVIFSFQYLIFNDYANKYKNKVNNFKQ